MAGSGEGPPRGVYGAREDTWLLASVAHARAGHRVLEIGAGSGEASLVAAREGARVVATDLHRPALLWLRRRARAEGLAIELVRTDLARGLGRFDLVLANPPYLPTPPESGDLDAGDRLALDGGPDGTTVTGRIVAQLADHLSSGGEARLLVSSVQDPAALAAIHGHWVDGGGRLDVIARRSLEGERLEVWRLTRVR